MASDFQFIPWKRPALMRLGSGAPVGGRLQGALQLKVTETRDGAAIGSPPQPAPFAFVGPRDVAELVPAAVLRTALQHKIGPYAPELPHTSDYEMWMRCALHSNIGFIRAVQGYYRLHGSNMSTAYHADPIRDWREAMQAVKKFVADAGDRVAAPDKLLGISRRRCIEGALAAAHRCFEMGDKEGEKTYLDFVADQDCSLSNFPAGRTLRLKQQLGLRGYRLLKPVLDFARDSGVSRPNVPRDPKLFGEWPTASSSSTAPSAGGQILHSENRPRGADPRPKTRHLGAFGMIS